MCVKKVIIGLMENVVNVQLSNNLMERNVYVEMDITGSMENVTNVETMKTMLLN